MRPRTAGLLLAAAAFVAAAPGHALESPCEIEDDLCAPSDADASCSAVGLYQSGLLDVARATTQIKDTVSDERDQQNPHATEVGYRTPAMPSNVPPQAQFDVSVHLGVVESWCHSYTHQSNTWVKSCGGAKVDEAIFTINRPTAPQKVRLIVEDMTTSVCRGAEPGLLGPVFDMRVGRVIIEVGSDAYPINIDPQQGTVLPVGSPALHVAINERFAGLAIGGCAVDGSTAIRVSSGGSQLIVGGVSIQTCRI